MGLLKEAPFSLHQLFAKNHHVSVTVSTSSITSTFTLT